MTQARTMETVEVAVEGAVATVTLANPPMNTINPTMIAELDGVLDELDADQEVRAVVFRSGMEGIFLFGADIQMLSEVSEDTLDELARYGGLVDKVARLRQPTVCAMGGTALGGGLEFALACDFRFLAEGFAEVGLPEVRLGVLPGWGGTQRLPRLVGAGVATEMILKGMRYDPQAALELGLVHRLVPAGELDAHCAKYAASLAAQAPLALQAAKRAIRAAFEQPGDAGLELERAEFAKLVLSSDAAEGLGAFLEGRKPSFTGS